MSQYTAVLVVAATLVACSACAPTNTPDTAVVRDSAGVRIVENPPGAPGPEWHLSREPVVEIGDASRGQEYELFQVWSALRLSDGRIVVANGGSHELRFYAPDGAFVRSVGRRGDGPGEFQNLRWMRLLAGDSIMTYDFRQRRFSVFDGSGAFIRSFRLQSTAAVPFASIIDTYADGSFLAQGFASTGDAAPTGLQRYDAPLYHFADDGTILTELGLFSGNEGFYKSFRDGGFAFYDSFFPRYTYRRAAGDHLYIAANDTYELRRYTPDGALTGIVRRAHAAVAVTEEHVQLERERRLAQVRSDDERQMLSGVLNEMPVPKTFPAYHLVRVDDERKVWVQEYVIPGINHATWSVFDAVGLLLGQVEAPLRFEPYHIGTDFVLGEWRDDLDVEYVRLYELVKP